jgi:hypothetical protein
MNETQDKSRIKQVAADLDNDLESRIIERILPYFAEDCVIEIFGIKLHGISDLKKWLKWFFDLFDTIKFEPRVIMVEDNTFFEEFIIHVSFKDSNKLSVKVAEVLEYKNYKIKSLRLYLDRLEFADAFPAGFLSRKIINLIKRKSLKGLV